MDDLHYVVRRPKIAINNPPLLVLLHGYGSNELDLFAFAETLPSTLLIISVRAPHELSLEQYAWYTIDFDASGKKISDLEQAKKSVEIIAVFIDQIKRKYKTDLNNTFLLGFSQGAILSYTFSFKYPNKVQYIVALSGCIDENLIPDKLSKNNIKTDYYSSHGTLDQVLPVDWARKTSAFLDALNIKHTYSEYPVGHTVSPKNFISFKSWIERRLNQIND